MTARAPAHFQENVVPTTVLTITGMTCGHCVQAVRNALAAVPGVSAVQVSLEQQQARVRGNADLARLLSAVEAEGYTAAVQQP